MLASRGRQSSIFLRLILLWNPAGAKGRESQECLCLRLCLGGWLFVYYRTVQCGIMKPEREKGGFIESIAMRQRDGRGMDSDTGSHVPRIWYEHKIKSKLAIT